MMKRLFVAAVVSTGCLAVPAPTLAQDMVYTPVNPSFGGNPLNSSHLLGLANAQRTATASDADRGSGGGGTDPGTTPGNTDADLFVRQLQGRLLSALASQVTEAIFGTDPQESGTVQFGDTTVTFERSIDSIRLIITDPTGVTEIVVPQLVTSSQASALASSLSGGGSELSTNIGASTLTGGDLVSGTSLSPSLD